MGVKKPNHRYVSRQEIEETINKIVTGQDININNYYVEREKIIEKLLEYKDNGNCLYYLGLLQDDDKYYKKAVKLGSRGARFMLGMKYYYKKHQKKGIKYGLESIRNGYCLSYWRINDLSWEYYVQINTRYREEVKSENTLLKERIAKLEQELQEEKYRPPGQGGSEYDNVAKHFQTLSKISHI